MITRFSFAYFVVLYILDGKFLLLPTDCKVNLNSGNFISNFKSLVCLDSKRNTVRLHPFCLRQSRSSGFMCRQLRKAVNKIIF